MSSLIRKHLAPPVFEDKDRTRAASLLNTVLLTILGATVFLTLTLISINPELAAEHLMTGTLVAVPIVGLLFLLHRGHVQMVNLLLPAALLAIITYNNWDSGGIRNIAISGYFLVIITAGLLSGGRAALAFGLLGISAALGLFYAETNGAIVVPARAVRPGDWIILSLVLGLASLLLRLAVNNIAQALEQAHRNERALAESNRELQREIAGRARVEEALKRAEWEKELILDSQLELVVYQDREQRILWPNRAACESVGATREELMGRFCYEIWAERSDPCKDCPVVLAMKTGQPQEIEKTTPDGRAWFVKGHPVRDANGDLVGAIEVVQDITGQVRAEEALRESEVKFRNIVESIPMGMHMYRLEPDGRFVFTGANPAADGILGVDNQQFVGQTIQEAFPALAEISEQYRLVASTGKTWQADQIIYEENQIAGAFEVRAFQTAPGEIVAAFLDITERVQAAKALQASEEQFRLLAEASLMGIFIFQDLKLCYVNPALARLFGYESAEILNKLGPLDLTYHKDHAASESYIRKCLSGQTGLTPLAFRGLCKGGNLIDCEVLATSINYKGKPAVIGTLLDITERVRAERLLRIQRDLGVVLSTTSDLTQALNQLLEATLQVEGIDSGGVYLVDAGRSASAGELGLAAHKGLYSQFVEGVSRFDADSPQAHLVMAGEPVYQRYSQVLPMADQVRQHESLRALAVIPVRYEGADKRPQVVAALNLASHTHDEIPVSTRDALEAMAAQIGGVIGRLRAEAALQESEEKYRLLVENAGEAISAVDYEGKFLVMNDAAARILGGQPNDFIGKTLWDILPKEVADERIAKARKVIQSGQGYATDICLPIQGQTRWFRQSTQPVRDESGEVTTILSLSTDITERVQAEEEVRRLNEELEQRVVRRTAQLEAANKELEAFAYSVSHDLRAPLRGIDGFSQALLEDYADRLDAEGQGYLRRVRGASQRMAQLIDDLLELSRVTRREMHCTKVDLSALAQGVAAELQGTQPGRQVEFLIAEGLVAEGDAQLLRVVLENLLSNAWKFTSKHAHARIEFGVIEVEDEVKVEDKVEVEGRPTYFVRDDGAGFDMAYADKLFGAFQRLHTVAEFEGTGIGLATVQRIVHRHGGRVWAEAQVNKGATFFFTLSG